VLPGWAAKVERFLRLVSPLTFASAGKPLPAGHAIDEYEMLAEKVRPEAVAAILAASKETMGGAAEAGTEAKGATAQASEAYEVPALAQTIGIEQLTPIDLRVAKVLACDPVEGSKKLLRLHVDLGPLGQRTIFSGIAKGVVPASLVGKHVMVVANLAPRAMKFGTSEGMVLVAGDDESGLTLPLLDPATSRPGERIT